MATNTHHPQDNWAHFRHIFEQLEDVDIAMASLLVKRLEIIKSLLEEGDQADHLDFVQQLQFDTTNTTLTVVPEVEPQRPRRRMVDAPEKNKPWTCGEEELVVAGRLLGLSNKHIGEKIGRSEKAVESRCTSLRAEGRM